MSDVGIGGGAPSAPSSAPSAPAGGGEAVINPSPVSLPSPIGPQTGQRTPEQVEDFKAGRRDTIAKAFDRARTDPVPTARAKPGLGHNQPPEPTAKEPLTAQAPPKKAEPPLDLKKRPVEEPPQREGRRRREERQRQERARGEHGHFAADPQGRQTPPGAPLPSQSRQAVPNPLPPHAPYREPPSRGMSPAAQRDWGHAPETVRADMHRMYREFAHASKQMRGAYEAMKPIAPYHRMAQEHGTTLAKALNNYTSMENKLRSDPVGGLDVIVNNLNLRTSDGRRLGLRDIAWHVLNQTPEQHQMIAAQNAQNAQALQLAQIQQRQLALEHHNAQMQHAMQFTRGRAEVDRFAETHPRLDELGVAIERELLLGFQLPEAYRRAELLHPAGPATHAAKTRSTSGETRDRSITGAPDSSLNGGPRRQKPSANPREAVASAMRRVGGLN
jgi:hypothetical protein